MRTQLVFSGCSYSLIGIHVHLQVFRVCSVLTQRCSHTLKNGQGVFSTDSKAFMHAHKCSGCVQYWLKGVHVHSQAFWECSVLTQMRTFSWSHHDESLSIMTQWHSCALTNVHIHSLVVMHTQWVFRGSSILTHRRSCALNECPGSVQYSLIGGHAHLMGVQGLFLLTYWH